MEDYWDIEDSPEYKAVRETLRVLFEDGVPAGLTVECRIFDVSKSGTISGYYDDFDKLAKHVAECNGTGAITVTLNQINAALLARSANKLQPWAKTTTSDKEVERRRFLFVDCDPTRPSEISSTEAEHEAALNLARQVQNWLIKEMGWPQPIAADSGNGAHLVFSTDLPNDDQSAALIKRVLQALAKRFDSETVTIDQAVWNAARLIKVWGTKAVKGDNISDRPHRVSRLLHTPKKRQLVTQEMLEVLAALIEGADASAPAAKPMPKTVNAKALSVPTAFDLAAFITQHGIGVHKVEDTAEGTTYHLDVCTFNADHVYPSAALVQFVSGAVGFKCFHASCADFAWKDVRQLYEPDAYTRRRTEQGANGDHMQIVVNNRQLRDVMEDTLEQIIRHNDPPVVFQRNNRLVQVAVDDHRHATIEMVTATSLRNQATNDANFVHATEKINKSGEMEVTYRHVFPPVEVMTALMASTTYPDSIPSLSYITASPVLSPKGILEHEQGYIPSARAYFQASERELDLQLPDPTWESVQEAVAFLRDELFAGFCFEDETGFAHTLATCLEAIVRPYIVGPTPGKLIEATVRASGKTLLAETIIAITAPTGVAPTSAPAGDDEWRKKITSELLTGPSYIWFDNIEGRLKTEALCVALTSTMWADRRLSVSEVVKLPIRCQFLLTANNAELHEDIATRCILIRLNPQVEKPEERKGFRIAHPPTYVRENRGVVLTHLLALVDYWIAQGRPGYKGEAVTRFPHWTATIGGILDCIGVPGFLANRKQLMQHSAPEVEAWREFVLAWHNQYGSREVACEHLCDLAFGPLIFSTQDTGGARAKKDERDAGQGHLSEYLDADEDKKRKMRLGKALRKQRGRVYGHVSIQVKEGRTPKFQLLDVEQERGSTAHFGRWQAVLTPEPSSEDTFREEDVALV